MSLLPRRLVGLLALTVPLSLGTVAAGPGQHGVTSDNVEHVAFVPFEVGTATGAQVVGDYLYVTSWKSFSIYDVSDPLEPQLLAQEPFGFKFENENVTTNGRIMLFAEQVPVDSLHVFDVEDKSNPTEIAVLDGAGTHTATCILDCSYSYGTYDLNGPEGPSTGATLVDLRDPADPKDLGRWNEKLPADKIHDVIEVSPGRVLTASAPLMYLDARKNPLRPKLLASGTNIEKREHSAVWPNRGKDRFIISSFETNATPRCEAGTGDLTVWDASKWRQTHTFTEIDHWRISNGTYVDGRPAANGLGCSPHWFQEHPSFRNGGILAAGFYDHGTRFLRVGSNGKISEVGYFLPWHGSTSAAYWLTDEVVYSVDYERGIDILRYKGKL
ncbi:MAG: LVIVD repeat-containing protein [Actinomycetota bacterium]